MHLHLVNRGNNTRVRAIEQLFEFRLAEIRDPDGAHLAFVDLLGHGRPGVAEVCGAWDGFAGFFVFGEEGGGALEGAWPVWWCCQRFACAVWMYICEGVEARGKSVD